MSNSPQQPAEHNGYSGFYFAAFLALLACSMVLRTIPPLGFALLLLWVLPSLIQARANIARQGRYLPLPWEDQFAAVVVGFILQIPLWLTAGFVSFLLTAFLLARVPASIAQRWSQEPPNYFIAWLIIAISVYLILFVATLAWSLSITYRDAPDSKRISIRDAKPIYHPF
ncbi:hypothetical protein AB1K70_26040 [Bremerella sp. JC770]|uniref:hypothetical protein n=1 Tax=Bremerella sp. JC770 TaxID=3232137 RepID=UPI0034598A82